MEIRTVKDLNRAYKMQGVKVFKQGFMAQVFDEDTIGISVITGIAQGLKYKGDVKRGLITAVTMEIVFGTANGLRQVYLWKKA